MSASPPVAKTVPKEITVHGDTRVDNYAWLRERDNPEVTHTWKRRISTPSR